MALLAPDGTAIFTAKEAAQHHPWCNHYMRERKGCKMCEGFYLKYPLRGGDTMADLMGRHFPNARIVS